MVPLISFHTSTSHPLLITQTTSTPFLHLSHPKPHLPKRTHFPISSISQNPNQFTRQNPQPPRTQFPGGFKRPEIKVPNIVLLLDPEDVFASDYDVLALVDKAVSKWVGILVLDGRQANGGRLYDAACKLKSLVKDRAYLLISERVDIAAAANASGILLSDQGLPTIVARSTMMASKSDSVVLPLVARNVQDVDAGVNASSSEGADFLIYSDGGEENVPAVLSSLFENVKIPIFVTISLKSKLFTEVLGLLKSGASGFVTSLKDFRMLDDDALSKLFDIVYMTDSKTHDEVESLSKIKFSDVKNGPKDNIAGFLKLEDREKKFIEAERSVLLKAINVIQRAAPLMEEVSLLIDAVSQIDEPFSLVIVGEFNSGKSTVINALLGRRYLKEGVVPTTNEITFLRYSEMDGEEQRCERHPDGQYICYLPAPILKEMNVVDTPGTNVILQRQQRLTEEFVPRADLLLFVISADRPLTESEVTFLRYTQQWKKKVVFVLNKSDIYRNANELEEAMSFIRENTQKLLNTEHVTLFPVSARTALEAKLASSAFAKDYAKLSLSDSQWKSNNFYELENFLYSFLDGSTSTGMERMKLKLETPIAIAEKLLSACETLVTQDCRYAKQDLASINDIVGSVKNYTVRMENESVAWRRRILSVIDTTKSRVVALIEATLLISNLDLVASYVFKGENPATIPATSRVQNDIIGPALLDVQKLLGEYVIWLQSDNVREGRMYSNTFEKRLPSFVYPQNQVNLERFESLEKVNKHSLKVIEDFSANAAAKLFEQEIREAFLGTFGGLGAAGLSASLLTTVLPTTLEDLLALGLCSAGGFIAISKFPVRRQELIEKVRRTADGLAREVEQSMQNDLSEAIENMENFVKNVSKPYQDTAQQRLDKLLALQDEISNVDKQLQTLRIEIQNLHVS
ncbi:probable transmembrane GTPase FZO-like, chloroplastic [Argentina anserina]|uniref:probable transmembrane GTPase FZO-like, chloroplastic n=1 Tax=Argentina anserina TaxID=57926 RepID=UPI0021763D9F|nr:probable transmembrane GTPase FZO-like, chloroplastic [Potentilla anserina]